MSREPRHRRAARAELDGPSSGRGASVGRDRAGDHMVRWVIRAAPDEEVAAVTARIARDRADALEAVYVVDGDGRLLGAVAMPGLRRADGSTSIRAIMDAGYPRIAADQDQEHAATIALAHRAPSVAVVDASDRLLGAVPAVALLEILRREHVEDLHRLAGIRREVERDRGALEEPPLRRARHRLPWLLVGLAGSMLAALVVSRFEALLADDVAVAFFVPAIVYLADAIGTQTEAIVVRGLSLSRLSIRQMLGGELRTGLAIGATLAAVAVPLVWLGSGPRLAVAVGTAILAAGGVATTIGLVLPWLLHRLGVDPAFGSGPVATILQDVLSLAIYLAIAAALLG